MVLTQSDPHSEDTPGCCDVVDDARHHLDIFALGGGYVLQQDSQHPVGSASA